MGRMDQKIMLIDGNSLLYRAFYALPLLQTSQGIFTNGVYGFFTMFNRVVAEEKPSHIVVAFDKSRDTFRREMYQAYKANRSAPPDELKGQFNLLREVLRARNIVYLEADGYEADDIIGTLCRKAVERGLETVVVTGDGDTLQLVSDHVNVIMTRKGISEIEKYDPAKVKEKWEVDPEQMKDIKGLMGDASDNIPGVPGVGAKTAIKLIKEFGALENLYKHLDQVKGKKLVEKLLEHREQAFLSRELGTIATDIVFEDDMDHYLVKEANHEVLKKIYKELEFNNFLRELEDRQVEKAPESAAGQILSVMEICSSAEMADLVKTAEQEGLSCILHSDSHHPMWGRLQAVYMESAGQIYLLDLVEEQGEKIAWLKTILEANSINKYLHNAKFAQVLLKRHGISLQGVMGDTMLMAYVIDPAFDGGELSLTMFRYLDLNADRNDYVVLVSRIKELFGVLAELAEDELKSLYYKVELPLSGVLADMEFSGIKVERQILTDISGELSERITQDEREIHELAGSQFNINSPKQMGKILFEDLGLRVIKKTKTGYSTGADILEELYEDHAIIPLILEYRQLAKLKSTYADALQGCIHPESGRVHTIFKQAQTATGRLSSIEPNLQNIPIRMEEGRRIRRAFTVRDDKHVILSADYSQIDLRSLAHISGDENLIETFREGIDIHARTAAEIFKVPLEAVTGELRYRAKAVNFGIIYGISDFGLARDTGVSRKEARMYIDNYLDSYPGVRRYMEDIVQFGKEHGYVETILKRRRYLPDLNASNKMLQSFARRMALNTPIQGTSADIIKLAMIEVDREIKSRELESRLLLQVHDDLILEVPEKEIVEVASLLTRCMENAYKLDVPLIVSLKMGTNWYDMQEFLLGQAAK
ncbi:dna polymerase i [hydrocarbon metagenome]|uniref:DNA-directed DNA polymerase n=1 Tax=hydrocarbon metagenome TaxID=938273 RepID=A0A0W8E5G0_9ZZZZ